MKRHIAMIYTGKGESRHRTTALVLISAAFLVGGVLGGLAHDKLPASLYIERFLRENAWSPTLRQELWAVFRWPVGLLTLRFLPFTGLSVPVIMSLRGFLLSYSISAFAGENMKTAVLLFGPTCILTLPVLFLLSTEILLRQAGEQVERKPAVILACLLALCLCIVIDLTVVPLLMA